MPTRKLHELAGRLLRQVGCEGPLEIARLSGGGNNRMFVVRQSGNTFLLKRYFHHPQDLRDRLAADYGFCRFAWERGIRCVPQPFAADAGKRAALFEFVRGQRLGAGEVSAQRMREALNFYAALNQHRAHPDAARIPVASEACFSLEQHLALVQRRVDRLAPIVPGEDVDRRAAAFVQQRLGPAWRRIRERTQRRAGRLPAAAVAVLEPSERRLSPSDFGFHNALLTCRGSLCFLDFEYAGWDDPAKLICDFFSQVAVPAPWEYFEEFASVVASGQGDPQACRQRAGLLLPVYQLKWCCIVLNEFSLVDSARRRFAAGRDDQGTRREQKLRQATEKLDEAMSRLDD